MRRPDFFTTQIYVRLTEDKTGFTYRVKRVGMFGPPRFVATSTNPDSQPSGEDTVHPRAESRNRRNER